MDALNGQTSYTYDLLGDITSITDANGNVTWFDYDDLGRLIDVRDPLDSTTGLMKTSGLSIFIDSSATCCELCRAF